MGNRKLNTIRLFPTINLIFGVIFIVAGIFAVISINSFMRQQALEDAESKSKLILDHNLSIHSYFSNYLKPSVFDLSDNLSSPDYFDPTWMSSTFGVRKIIKTLDEKNDGVFYYKEAAINARSPDNEADNFEKDFLLQLNSNPDLDYISEIREIDNEPFFVTIHRGEKMEESCLLCHGDPDEAPQGLVDIYGSERSFYRSVGETVSAISIRIPLEETYSNVNSVTVKLSIMLIIILAILLISFTILNNNLLRHPLKVIKDGALSIANKDVELGHQIPLPLGEELRNVTNAINTMSRNLKLNHDQLEKKIADRTKELNEVNEHLILVSTHDSLTKIPNRILFNDRFFQTLVKAKRNKEKFAVMFADINDFKKFNDQFGHQEGDKLLQLIAQNLNLALRESDTIARIGGDEFAVILDNVKDENSVLKVIKRMIENLIKINVANENYPPIIVSIGISLYPKDADNIDDLLTKADTAMYKCKSEKSKNYIFYKEEI